MDSLYLCSQSPSTFTGIWVLLMLAGAIKSFQLAARPRSHAACCIALGLVPSAWVVFSIYGQVAPFVADHRTAKFATMVGFMTVGGLAMLSAFFLAIAGLIHYSVRAKEYDQGRKQGIWAIVLSLALGAIMVSAFVHGVRSGGAGLSGAPKAVAAPGQELRFEKENFSYTPPPGPWVAVDPSKLNPLAKVAAIRKQPEVLFFVIASEVGNVPDPAGGMRELALADLRTVGEDFELVQEDSRSFAGLIWQRLVGRATVPAGRMTYHYLITFHHGYAYQALVFSRQAKEAALESSLGQLMSGFTLLDPDRYAPSLVMHEAFASPHHGYAIPALELPWQRWTEDELGEHFSEAEVAVSYAEQGYHAVVPLHVGGEELPLAALVHVLLSSMEIDPGDEALVRVDEQDVGAEDRQTFTYAREVEGGHMAYRLQILRLPHRALLLASWCDTRVEDQVAPLLADLMAKVSLEPAGACDPASDLTERDQSWHATAYLQIGSWFSQRKRPEEAIAWYQRSYRCQPTASALTRWAEAVNRNSSSEAALEVLRPHVEAHADAPRVLTWWAYLNTQAGDREVARTAYARAFEIGHDNVHDLIDYAHLLRDMDALDEAYAVLEAHQHLSPRVTVTHAHLLAQRDPEAALGLVEARDPEGTRFAGLRIELFHEAGLYTRAVELGQARVERGQANGMTHFRLGESLLELGWLKRAREEFELALRLGTEKDVTARKLLAHVESLLGQGNRDAIRDPIDPVALPEALLSKIEPVAADDPTGARYLLRTRAVRFVSNTDHRETLHLRLKILDDAAAAKFSTLTFTIDPAVERLYVNRLQIFDAVGRVVAKGEPGEHYLAARQDADSDMVLNVTVPALTSGRVIDLVLTRQQRAPSERLPLLSHCFSSSQPCDVDAFYVEVDRDLVACEGNAGTPPARQLEGGLAWVMSAPPRYVSEPLQPHYATTYPFVQVASKRSWSELGSSYLEQLTERLPTPPSVAEVASAVVTDGMDAAARTDVLADHVRGLLTYKAIEFGIRGWVPHPSTKTLERRYGDCKDHALLLYQLLKAAEVPAHLTLVNLGRAVSPELPSLDAFNHMVVYVPGVRGGLLVDVTDKDLATAATPVPIGLGGRRALVLDPSGPALITAPAYPPDSSRLRLRRQVRLDGRDLVVDEQFELRGYYSGFLRGSLRGADDESARAVIERMLGTPSVQLETLELAQVDAIDRPLVFEVRYRVRDAVHQAGDLRVGALPAAFESYYFWQRKDRQRTTPFELEYPLLVNGEVKVIGASLADGAPPQPTNLLDFETRVQANAKGALMTYRIRRPAGRWDAAQWAEWLAKQQAMLDSLKRRFRASGE